MIPNRNERRADSIATPAACREVPRPQLVETSCGEPLR